MMSEQSLQSPRSESAEENLNKLNTAMLFGLINQHRKRAGEPEIDDSLLASKLGILIAVKTDRYANFKQPQVGLTGHQLIALESILEENFNVTVYKELYDLVQLNEMPGKSPDKQKMNHQNSPGLLSRLKGFFGRKRSAH